MYVVFIIGLRVSQEQLSTYMYIYTARIVCGCVW